MTEVKIEDKTYNVYIEADSKTYKSIKEIENETVTSPLGIEVPIKDVAKVEKEPRRIPLRASTVKWL